MRLFRCLVLVPFVLVLTGCPEFLDQLPGGEDDDTGGENAGAVYLMLGSP